MNNPSKKQTTKDFQTERLTKEAAALRENLKRRKRQQQAKKEQKSTS